MNDLIRYYIAVASNLKFYITKCDSSLCKSDINLVFVFICWKDTPVQFVTPRRCAARRHDSHGVGLLSKSVNFLYILTAGNHMTTTDSLHIKI